MKIEQNKNPLITVLPWHLKLPLSVTLLLLLMAVTVKSWGQAPEIGQYQHWLELLATDQTFADRSAEIGRTQAFLEFLGEESVFFRDSQGGPIDALELYSSEEFQATASQIGWEAHYIDVSRDGDLGLSAGPLTIVREAADDRDDDFGHLISVWKKTAGNWELVVDIVAPIPGFLSLEVEPNFEDTRQVLAEVAHPAMAMAESNNMQSLIDADNLFGQSINFRGGQRALLRWGLENSRVYLPGMAAAVGAESASSVYGAFLDNQLSTTNPISLTYIGGYISTSKDMGYTYGTMATNVETTTDGEIVDNEERFQTSYLRLWRFTASNEWKIAVEVLDPF